MPPEEIFTNQWFPEAKGGEGSHPAKKFSDVISEEQSDPTRPGKVIKAARIRPGLDQEKAEEHDSSYVKVITVSAKAKLQMFTDVF